jgi:hypothetical protein
VFNKFFLYQTLFWHFLTKGRLTKGRLTKGRLTKGRSTKGRLTKGRSTKGHLTNRHCTKAMHIYIYQKMCFAILHFGRFFQTHLVTLVLPYLQGKNEILFPKTLEIVLLFQQFW